MTPRVTDEHRAARRRQITGAALKCVLRNGFHKTTMADVIAESGLSAGAVYGYFKSKRDIIKALADLSIGSVADRVHRLVEERPEAGPADVLEGVLEAIMELAELPEGDLTRVGVQTWAESLRDEDIHALVAPRLRAVRDTFAVVARRSQAEGRLPADADPEKLAQVMFALVPGFTLQRLLLGDISSAAYVAAFRTLVEPRT